CLTHPYAPGVDRPRGSVMPGGPMAQPLSASGFLKALKAEGLTVVEVGDWRDHSRNHKGPWGPVHGVMIHHTVTKGSQTTVDICRRGYSGLPGPLCHGVRSEEHTSELQSREKLVCR